VPADRPESVAVGPAPVIAPGLMIQLPAGKLFNTTDPVARVQVGWVMAPAVGAGGVSGCALMTILADATDVHPAAFVTV